MRLNLKVIQRLGDKAMYGLALVEYANILGELKWQDWPKGKKHND